MPHTPQDALLAAVLHVLDAPRDEDGALLDPETVQAEAEKIAAYKDDAEQLSLDAGEKTRPSAVDQIMTGGLGPALTVAEEIRRKVRRLAQKKYPPRS